MKESEISSKATFFQYQYEFILNAKFWANSESKQSSINILLCEEETQDKD